MLSLLMVASSMVFSAFYVLGTPIPEIGTNLGDGVISLTHEPYIDNVETVRRVLEYFSKQGYKFVTIDELFAIKGVDLPDQNRLYYSVY